MLGFETAAVDLLGAALFFLKLPGVFFLLGFLDRFFALGFALRGFGFGSRGLAERVLRFGLGVHFLDRLGFRLFLLSYAGFLRLAFETLGLLLLHLGAGEFLLLFAAAFEFVGDALEFENTVGFQSDVDRAANPPFADGQLTLRVQLVDRHVLPVGSIVDVEIVGFVLLEIVEEFRHEGLAVLGLGEDHFVGDLRRHIVPENAVLHGESRKHLVEVGVVHLLGGVFDRQFVPGALVALDELPESDALAQVAVLVDRVGVHDRGSDVVLPHHLHEGGGGVGGNDLFQVFEAFPEFGFLVRILLRPFDLGGGGDLHIQTDLSAHRRGLEFALVGEDRRRRGAPVLADRVVAARNEDVESVDQRVDEAVLVGLHRLVAENVQDLGRRNGVALDLTDIVGVLGKMPHRAAGDVARQFNRQNRLVFLDESAGFADDVVERDDAVLDDLDPRGVQRFAHHLALHRDLARSAPDHILDGGEHVDVSADIRRELVHPVVDHPVLVAGGRILFFGYEGIAGWDITFLVRLGDRVDIRNNRSVIRRPAQVSLCVHNAPFRRSRRLLSGFFRNQNIFCRRSR